MPRLVEHRSSPANADLNREHYETQMLEVVELARSYSDRIDADEIYRGFEYAYDMHEGQVRKSGIPYIEHPLEVARILVHLKLDQDTIVAGLLHDVVEDCADRGASLLRVTELFGTHVALLVDGVTKIGGLKFKSSEHQQSVNYRKMLLSISQDVRVIFVKFADRLHNMRTIGVLRKDKAERIARETLEVYAPLANRFGIGSIKWELEDLCLKVIEPEFYDDLVAKIEMKREERQELIEDALAPIRKRLEDYGLKNYKIFGRPKHFYSIYNKIHKRQKSFEEILDLFATRILVDNIGDCYFALGVVHNLYTPIHDRFSDFIATPKSNGYQSLHTKVVGPRGRTLEVQIRTHDMNRIAEYGLAAHWLYKEGAKSHDENMDVFFGWIKHVLEEDSLGDPSKEFLDNFKINLYQEDIFVFSPGGDLFKLQRGSSPIDFAFAIHTTVGLTCIGAKVDSKIVPLDFELTSGVTVEVITSKNQKPSIDWLQIVKTNKARSRIKRWLRESQYVQSLELGNEVLRKEFQKNDLKMDSKDLESVAQSLGFHNADKMMVAVGNGDLPVANITRKLIPEEEEQKDNLLSRIFKRGKPVSSAAINIQGLGDMVVHFSKCCQPLPGDDIVGFIVSGAGVKVHRRTCPNINQLLSQPEKLIDVEWDSDRNQHFNSRIMLVATERRNLIRDISDILAKMDVNIIQFTMRKQDELAIGKFVLEVKNLGHLSSILKKLRSLKKVIRVIRHDSGTDW
jgi:GTP diphosphokinase / guanosine-3',5'-bis(diphosphate) 3'-diphosphatase